MTTWYDLLTSAAELLAVYGAMFALAAIINWLSHSRPHFEDDCLDECSDWGGVNRIHGERF